MATNKFLKFDESDTNMLDFTTYQASLIRTNGFPFGSKPPSNLTNRYYRDTAAFVYAFGEYMKAYGIDASPDDIPALISNIPLAVSASAIAKALNTSGTDAYAVTVSGVTAYEDGYFIIVETSVANTGASTLNINALGAKSIKKYVNAQLVELETLDILQNTFPMLIFNTTADAFILWNAQSVVYESPFYVDPTWDNTYTYDSQGRLSTAAYTRNAVAQKTFTYTYNASNQISTVAVLVGAVTTTIQYSYDSQGRLTGRAKI